MSDTRIAVIGAGISGMSAAYLLGRTAAVWLIETETRLGGHTHTHRMDTSSGKLALDSGFLVFNSRTYPNLIRLFDELRIASQPSDMSFGIADHGRGIEYSSRGLRGFMADRRNMVRIRHYRLFAGILRFNREARRFLDQPADDVTLAAFMDRDVRCPEVRDHYVYPMASAIWSTSGLDIGAYPAAPLLRFFRNHGLLSITGQPEWRVVTGGSDSYIGPLTASFRERILTGTRVRHVRRVEGGVEVSMHDRPSMRFDHVVFACRAAEALRLIDTPSDAEREVLSDLRTTVNEAVLHTDVSLLPRRDWARASWNYRIGGVAAGGPQVTYHLNRLQTLPPGEDFCVSLNANGTVDPGHVRERMTYHHPLYDPAALRAQRRWPEISGVSRLHFCGAYWFNGFHEDGLNSAIRVAHTLGVRW